MAKKAAKKESAKETSKAEKPAKKTAAPKAEAKKEAAPKATEEKKEKKAKEPKEVKEKEPKKSAKMKREEAARAQALIDADARWSELKEKHGKEKAPKYIMTGQFQPNTPIEHPKLGWGFVLTNNNDRLEVLFQDGVKILISNYGQTPKI